MIIISMIVFILLGLIAGGIIWLLLWIKKLNKENLYLKTQVYLSRKKYLQLKAKHKTSTQKINSYRYRLKQALVERKKAESALHAANQELAILDELSKIANHHQVDLHLRLESQKNELAKANDLLKQEIQERKKAEEKAAAANQAKSIFLANMNHELRTPLNAILGFAQLMARDRQLSEEHQQHLDIICRSGEHLLALINDVLEVSKIEAGIVTLNITAFDLKTLLYSLEKMFQLTAASKGLQLALTPINSIPKSIKTDEGKLRQVLINLLGNAIKFTGQGEVSLRVYGQPQSADSTYLLTFEIADTGPGILPHELEHLFEPFIQTEVGRKSQQGTGLGLTISRKFIQLMGGEITVSSEINQGTIFKFSLPVTLPETTEILTQNSTKAVIGLATNQPQYRLLVVEDRWENRQLLQKLLESVGFKVKFAENGQEGVELWQLWQPHLILMDIRMPVMDGYQATQKIRELEQQRTPSDQSDPSERLNSQHFPEETLIIAITASAFEDEHTHILSVGCNDFIRKPFREEFLLAKIADHLGVRYIYEKNKSLSLSLAKTPELTEQDLAIMPVDWISQLYQAARVADEEWVLQLLQEIPSSETKLAKALRNWVTNFRCDKIMAICQTQLK